MFRKFCAIGLFFAVLLTFHPVWAMTVPKLTAPPVVEANEEFAAVEVVTRSSIIKKLLEKHITVRLYQPDGSLYQVNAIGPSGTYRIAYDLSSTWTRTPGDWTIRVMQGDRVVAERVMKVKALVYPNNRQHYLFAKYRYGYTAFDNRAGQLEKTYKLLPGGKVTIKPFKSDYAIAASYETDYILNGYQYTRYERPGYLFNHGVSQILREMYDKFQPEADIAALRIDVRVRHKLGTEKGTPVNSEEVVFIMPRDAVAQYLRYEITGQQLMDASVVTIDNERVSLVLQYK